MSDTFILAQLSDTHVGGALGERDAADALRSALQDVARYRPHAIMMTGDLANVGLEPEYRTLREALQGATAPIYMLPGNHDDRALMRAIFPDHAYLGQAGELSHVVDTFPVRLVCVDQIDPPAVGGTFSEARAAWLDRTLAAAPDKPTIVALHHPPFATHDRLFDTIGLGREDLFESVIARHSQVTRIICGHHHRTVLGQIAHAPVFVAPSTAWGFSLAIHDDQAVAQRLPQPGWALHVWRAGRGLASHVMPL